MPQTRILLALVHSVQLLIVKNFDKNCILDNDALKESTLYCIVYFNILCVTKDFVNSKVILFEG